VEKKFLDLLELEENSILMELMPKDGDDPHFVSLQNELIRAINRSKARLRGVAEGTLTLEKVNNERKEDEQKFREIKKKLKEYRKKTQGRGEY
jgi:hypothetical protein